MPWWNGYKTPVVWYDEAEHFLKTGELFEKGQTMLETETWTRKSFPVKAVRITRQNIDQVAEWCGGTICKSLNDNPQLYIALEKTEYNKIRISRAYIGDWVLLTNGIFKNYRNDKFGKSFDPPVQSRVDRLDKIKKTHDFLREMERKGIVGFPDTGGLLAEEIVNWIEGGQNGG